MAWVKTASVSVYLAGPGIELVAAALVGQALGWDVAFSASDDVGVIAAQAFMAAAAAGAITNLIPMRAGDDAPNDGLGACLACFGTGRRTVHSSNATDTATFD